MITKKNTITMAGKEVILYSGLLNEAHQAGLTSIITTLLQFPSEENANTAVVSATVTLGRGDEQMVFTGIGDASPANVSRAMAANIIRMAETRAKGRALKDAVNIGEVEISGVEADSSPSRSVRQPTQTAGKCLECGVSKGEPGPHHAPKCSNKTEKR